MGLRRVKPSFTARRCSVHSNQGRRSPGVPRRALFRRSLAGWSASGHAMPMYCGKDGCGCHAARRREQGNEGGTHASNTLSLGRRDISRPSFSNLLFSLKRLIAENYEFIYR
ncbi:hypothetical protein CHELA40_13499 [Chelatococcus asaccharovorans]|nr:hypothetical protein CHELA40_13499 [Chelatococcus asaccharovorans]CAH1677598.1 hypothetical protein CHELA17_62121 [Chelatococcus asaccharovorans]